MKTGCLIYSDNLKYKKLHDCAVKSFSKFNPDVEVYSVDYQHEACCRNSKVPAGVFKYSLAADIFNSYNLDKIIILGADTITCSRLDEFLDDNSNDIIATLDYPYPLITENKIFSQEHNHLNADVVCFNNLLAIFDILEEFKKFPTKYYEQAALNYVCHVKQSFKFSIADGDYDSSLVVYNARAKGNICSTPNAFPWGEFVSKFEVKDNKLYTGTHRNVSKSKQIKVWHYCDGLGNRDNNNFSSIINTWINEVFNKETKNFFKNNCDCGDFFHKPFSIDE